MAKCGDCFHFQKCSHYVTPEETFPEVGGCSAFRSKGDFVEVVRCKDCKHYGRIKGLLGLRCDLQDNQIWCKDDFCSYGERREGE